MEYFQVIRSKFEIRTNKPKTKYQKYQKQINSYILNKKILIECATV